MAVLKEGRGHWIGETSGVVELWAACYEDLQNVLAIILHPAYQSVLEVRVPHVRRGLGKKKERKKVTCTDQCCKS